MTDLQLFTGLAGFGGLYLGACIGYAIGLREARRRIKKW